MPANTSVLISVIVPICRGDLPPTGFIQELQTTLASAYEMFEIIVVDDGSDTEVSQSLRSSVHSTKTGRYVRFSRSFGMEAAISAGLDLAIGDFIAILVPGYDPLEKVIEIVSECRKSDAIIIGRRKPTGHALPYKVMYHSFYWFCNRFLALNLVPNVTYFMALSRNVLNSFCKAYDSFKYIKTMAFFSGFPIQFFDYVPVSTNNLNRRSMFESINLALDIIVSNSLKPLRWVSILGVLVSGINLLYFIYIGLIALFKDKVAEGWITLSTQNALGFFVISLVIGTISEYLGRVLVESQDRPPYFVVEDVTTPSTLANMIKRGNVVTASRESTGDA